MKSHLHTVISVLVILFSLLVALIQPVVALLMIGGVLIFGLCLLVYRLVTRP